MILYKYVDLRTYKKIIDDCTVRFSTPNLLNDPFETSCKFYESEGSELSASENHNRTVAICDNYGILSLSRSATNPLMWAHYAKGKKRKYKKAILLTQDNDAHGGMVIGIDTEAAELDSNDINVIPAKFGNVIYTATKPNNPFEESENFELFNGRLLRYSHALLEALQRTFLYKSTAWSYEEEVRVVRKVEKNNLIYKINRDSIREIYIGSGHNHDILFLKLQRRIILSKYPNCKIYVCYTHGSDWGINYISVDDYISKAITQRFIASPAKI